MTFSVRSLLVIAAIVSGSSLSFGSILTPGNDVVAVSSAAPVGVPLFTTGTLPYATSPPFISGTYSGSVYQETLAANPLGGLTFVYIVSEAPTSIDTLEHVVVSNFAGFQTDVSYNGATAPTDINRKAFGAGDDVSFNFVPTNVPVGGTTGELIVRTNAATYALNNLSLINNSTATVTAVGPSPTGGSSPEPASLGLLSLGGVALLRRRRA